MPDTRAQAQAETTAVLMGMINRHEENFLRHTQVLESLERSVKELQISSKETQISIANFPTPDIPSFTTQPNQIPSTQPPQALFDQSLPNTQTLHFPNTSSTQTFPNLTDPPYLNSHITPNDTHRLPNPCRPRLELSQFNGENVAGWLFQITNFFIYHNTPEDQKLTLESFYMVGPALQWYHWMHRTHQLSSWDSFVHDLELRFGPSIFQNPEAALYKLKQRSSVTAYLAEFEILSNQTIGLTPSNLLNCFISGLRDDIQRELALHQPVSLSAAIGMEKLIEEKCDDMKRPLFRPANPRPTPPALSHPSNHISSNNPSILIRRLTPVEIANRRAQGLCFNCDDRFTPGHRCKQPRFLCLLINESDESETPELPDLIDLESPDVNPSIDCPNISIHALEGHFVPTTLRIQASIKGKLFTVLIDGGSTHNFMQARVARFVHLPIELARHLAVTMGNGDSLSCEGFRCSVPVVMNNHEF